MIATCSQDRTIKLWNEELMNTMVLAGHRRGVWDAIFHDVEELLVSVAGDGMMKGWNLISGECLWSMGEGPALIRCSWLYYNQVVTGSLDGIIKIWDIRKQTSLSYDKHNGKIWALDVLTHEGKPIQIISGGTDSTYHIWVENTKNLRDQIMDR
jgi:WD40 repeat protein